MEPPWAAGAGVQPEKAILLLLEILVGVAEHHCVDPREVHRDLFFVMHHVKGHPAQGDGEVMGNVLRPLLVVVAPDDVQRRVLPQLIYDLRPVDVPGVEDGVGGL